VLDGTQSVDGRGEGHADCELRCTVPCGGAQASDEANPCADHEHARDSQIWHADAIDVMVRRALAVSRSADLLINTAAASKIRSIRAASAGVMAIIDASTYSPRSANS
jgi:hypothetical protein